jgi:hypothetical protein
MAIFARRNRLISLVDVHTIFILRSMFPLTLLLKAGKEMLNIPPSLFKMTVNGIKNWSWLV